MLYSFTGGADGEGPYAGVIRDSAGNLDGTTLYGGAVAPESYTVWIRSEMKRCCIVSGAAPMGSIHTEG